MAIYRDYLTIDDSDAATASASQRVSNAAEIRVQLEQQLKGTIEKSEVQVQLLSAQMNSKLDLSMIDGIETAVTQAAVETLKIMCKPTDEGGKHMTIRADYNGRIAEYQVMTQLTQLPEVVGEHLITDVLPDHIATIQAIVDQQVSALIAHAVAEVNKDELSARMGQATRESISQFVQSSATVEVAAASAAQTIGSAHQQKVIAEMHKNMSELCNLNYDAVKAQRIAEKIEKEHMDNSETRRRERQQPGATLSALSDTDATKAHVAEEKENARAARAAMISKACDMLGMGGVPIKEKNNKVKLEALKVISKLEFDKLTADEHELVLHCG